MKISERQFNKCKKVLSHYGDAQANDITEMLGICNIEVVPVIEGMTPNKWTLFCPDGRSDYAIHAGDEGEPIASHIEKSIDASVMASSKMLAEACVEFIKLWQAYGRNYPAVDEKAATIRMILQVMGVTKKTLGK